MSPYFQAFLLVLPKRPIKALKIAWWWITRRRVRSLGQLRAAAADLPENYPFWLSFTRSDHGGPQAMTKTRQEFETLPPIAVHLHLPIGHSLRLSNAAIKSVLCQLYPGWTLYVTSADSRTPPLPHDPRVRLIRYPIATRAAALTHVLESTVAPYVVPLTVDCRLTPAALLALARAIIVIPRDEIAVFYADQDEENTSGQRRNPWFKPQWDEDLFLAQDYLSAACAIPAEAVRRINVDTACADDVAVYALLTRLLLGTTAIPARHVPHVAMTTPANAWCAASQARAGLVRAIAQGKVGAAVTNGPFGTLVVHRTLPDPLPRISVIVPTRNRIELLRTCLDGLARTDYSNLEVMVIDNDSDDPATLTYLAGLDPARHRVLRYPGPYNYSAINNFAVSQTTAPYICLLNNDTEVIDSSWLREMVAHAVRPEVGAVGARLLYPDLSIQHAGVVVGLGNAAGHAHRGLPDNEPGYFAQAYVARTATAVTAACLVVSKAKFDVVSGLDEKDLAVAYNDVDLCLKLRRAGWRNIYVPQASLIHHESKSRGQDFAPEHMSRYMRELKVFQERWGTIGFHDPTHHTALDPASEQYRLML